MWDMASGKGDQQSIEQDMVGRESFWWCRWPGKSFFSSSSS